nr:siderophore-interacting protein [Kibdelosporangium sp. MJ126-NF4]CEL18455.1 iron-chelator utilization protein [Kibdelosporangium sp. MJ126-NF4]CTQ97938.1 iron-chelator utilization protein [Kibdelosporangium sp. MJ126-NF4]
MADLAYWPVEVRRITAPTPGTRRVTFGAPGFEQFPKAGPDQYFKLFMPLAGQTEPRLPDPVEGGDVRSWYVSYLSMPDELRPPMRTFTVRHHRADHQEIDVDFVVHDDGAAQRWLRTVEPGDKVTLLGANSLYHPPAGTEWQLLIGDETAVPAISAIVEQLPPGTRAVVIADVPDAGEELKWDTEGDVDTTWLHRGSLLDAVRAATLPQGQCYAWVAGEASMVRDVRRHLVGDRAFPKNTITFTGYWRVGRTEEQVSRDAVETGTRDEDD